MKSLILFFLFLYLLLIKISAQEEDLPTSVPGPKIPSTTTPSPTATVNNQPYRNVKEFKAVEKGTGEKVQTGTFETAVDPEATVYIQVSNSEKQKMIVLLRKLFPKTSVSNLSKRLSQETSNGKIALKKKELDALYLELQKTEYQESSLFDKIASSLSTGPTAALTTTIREFSQALTSNPMSILPEEEIKKILVQQAEGKWLEGFFTKYPKSLDFMAKMIRDKIAIPKLLSILEKQNELKTFFLFSAIIQVVSILSFFFLFKGQRYLTRLWKRTLLFTCFNGMLVGYFIWVFWENLAPTFTIAGQVF